MGVDDAVPVLDTVGLLVTDGVGSVDGETDDEKEPITLDFTEQANGGAIELKEPSKYVVATVLNTLVG